MKPHRMPVDGAMDDIATCGEISCDECNLRTQALRARIAELETGLKAKYDALRVERDELKAILADPQKWMKWWHAECDGLKAIVRTDEREIETLRKWQDLAFELLTEIRKWVAPGAITDLEAVGALRALLSDRARVRSALVAIRDSEETDVGVYAKFCLELATLATWQKYGGYGLREVEENETTTENS